MNALLLYCLAVSGLAGLMFLLVALCRLAMARYKPSAAARGVFRYSDGVNVRSIDPIAAMIALEAHPTFRIDKHLKQAYEGDSESVNVTAQAARDVFGVPAFERENKPGLTISESYRLMCAFLAFVQALSKPPISANEFVKTDISDQNASKSTCDATA